MRNPDTEVREVLCSETGKPMPKIPLWMADIKVKFVSEEELVDWAQTNGDLEVYIQASIRKYFHE